MRRRPEPRKARRQVPYGILPCRPNEEKKLSQLLPWLKFNSARAEKLFFFNLLIKKFHLQERIEDGII